MGESRRVWLIELREGRRWSQIRLAELLGVDSGTVGRWERGAQNIRFSHQEALAHAFQLSVRQLVALAGDDLDEAKGPTGRSEVSEPARPVTDAARDSSSPVDSLRSVIDGSRGLDHSVGPTGTLDIVRAHLAVAERLDKSTANPGERSQLLGLTAQIHQLVGWMSFDTLDLTSARLSFDNAKELASAADDPALMAYILGPSAAFAEADVGDPRLGLELVYAAIGWARRAGNQRLLAFVLTISARVHAKLGDELLSRQALDDAAAALANHDSWELDPVWLRVFDETALLGHSGSCDLDLDRPSEAIELLDRQDTNSAEIYVRNRAIWRLDRAAALRNLDEVDQACHEVTQALDLIDLTSSPRTRFKLNQVAESLTSAGPTSRAALDLNDRLQEPSSANIALVEPLTEADENTDT